LKQLQDLDYKVKREKYKTLPEHALPRTKFSDSTANGLTRAIVTWLELNGHWASRITTTGRYIGGSQHTNVIGQIKLSPGKWIPGTTRRGTSDIHAVVKGRHVSIEVKIGKDRMSEDQIKTKESIEKSGGVYFIAKDFDSFLKFYNTLTK
jgi:hypothetical protein